MAESRGAEVDPSRQQSLRYFNLFRLIMSGIFIVAGRELNLGSEHPSIYFVGSVCYLASILALGFPDAARFFGFNRLVTLQVVLDVILLTVIMWASGGFRSGMPVLMMIMLAGAGLVAEGRMVLFLAAVATVAVLAENGWRYIADGTPGDFLQVGITCVAFFGIALVARLLAQRAKYNATLAQARGEALVSQQAVNERIIRDMRDGVIVLGADGVVRQANPQAAVLLGLQRIEGLVLADIDHGFADCREQCCGADGRMMRLGAARRLLRCRVMEADAEAAVAGDALVYITDFEDIQRQMQQLKLAALGRLTASMAHEIRNPLSAVSQAAELLQDEKRTDMQARLARIINDNAHRIERMIRDVLALGRREQALPEALLLAPFVAEVVDAQGLRGDAECAVFKVDIDPALTLAIDRAHLHQILDNLLSNARRYCTGKAGAVRVHGVTGDDGLVSLHVQDDGPGIEEALRVQVFEPFFTTHAKGTGLGLYIARELAEANDATLELRPETPGAHFVLTGRSRP